MTLRAVQLSITIAGGILFAILALLPSPDELSAEKILFYGFVVLWPSYCLAVGIELFFRKPTAGRAFWVGILIITASGLLFVTTRGHVSDTVRIGLSIGGIIAGYAFILPFVKEGTKDRHQK